MRLIPFLALSGALTLLFVLAPALDPAFSHLFFAQGRGFFLKDWPPFVFLYEAIPWVTRATVAFVVLAALAHAVRLARPFLARPAVIAYVGLSLAIGPGLISNVVLKDNLGRARPAQTVEFGGERAFTPAFVTSDQCAHNCAFVSGHAAIGFFTVTFAFLMAPGRWRRAAFTAALGFGAAVGLARIAQGAHYLSDVVFAGLFNFAVAWALFEALIRRDGLAHPALARTWRWLAWRARDALRPLRFAARRRSAAVARAPVLASGAAVALLAVLSYLFLDRPAAEWFKTFGPDLHGFFKGMAALGLSTGWLVGSAASAAGLWAASVLPAFAAMRERLRAFAMLPAFLFASILSAGIVVNVMKIIFGRARPKLYFLDGTYGFDWFRLEADYLSFPSGHANAIVACMTALYFIAPRHVVAYVLIGAVIALARAVQTAHYLSDVMVGAWLAIVITAWMRGVFARSGIAPATCLNGRFEPAKGLTWRQRLAARSDAA